MASIPTRYETDLFKGHREYLGFGSHGLRFETNPSAKLPGPGQYAPPKSFTQVSLEREGLGKRGTGSFASRSVRLGPRAVSAIPIAGRGVPGPGKYEDQAAVSAIKDGRDFTKAVCSSAFAGPTAHAPAHPPPPAPPQPGPGYYKPVLPPASSNSAVCASFKSNSSQRGDEKIAASDFPGPGEYSDRTKSAFKLDSEACNAARVQDNYSSVFKVPSRPKIVSVNPDLPTVDHAGREALGSFADVVGHECKGTKGLAISLPGPGKYEQNSDGLWSGKVVGNKGLSSFLPGPERIDWAGDAGDKPGPGRYEPKRVDQVVRLVSAASVFDSSTERIKLPNSDAPGPAYYEPKIPSMKKCFRAKVPDMWVPVSNA